MVKQTKKAPTAAGTAISASMPKHENSDIVPGSEPVVKGCEESAIRNLCLEYEKERRSITLTNMQWLILGEAVRVAIREYMDLSREFATQAFKGESVFDLDRAYLAYAYRDRAMALREILRLIR